MYGFSNIFTSFPFQLGLEGRIGDLIDVSAFVYVSDYSFIYVTILLQVCASRNIDLLICLSKVE